MKAAIYYGPRDIRLEEIEKPRAGEDGIVVKVRAAGICGGDLHAYRKAPIDRPPGKLVYGHENAGDVVEVGANIKDIKVGDRVFAEALLLNANRTGIAGIAGLSGLHGGFAEYLWVPVIMRDKDTGNLTNIFKLPDTMSYQDGALIEPVGIGTAAVRTAAPQSGEVAFVMGTGIIGLGTVVTLKAAGLSKIIVSDVSEKRLKAALEMGADMALNPTKDDVTKRVMEETSNRGADIVVETAGLPATFLQSINIARPGGRIVVVAYYEESVQFKPHTLINRNVRIIPGRGADWPKAFELIKAGKITDKQVVTHTFPLHRINEAFETAGNSQESIKVMIEP